MSLDSIPIVPGRNLMGHIHRFQSGDRLGFFQNIAETGELARVFFLGRPVVFANSPASAHEVLVEKARCFEKSPGIRLLLHYLAGEGSSPAKATSGGGSGASWRPSFSPRCSVATRKS